MYRSPRWLIASLLILAVGALALSAREDAPTRPADPTADARAKFAREKYEQLMKETQGLFHAPPAGDGAERPVLDEARAERFIRWSLRWMEAERDRAAAKDGRIAAIQGHLDRIRQLEEWTPKGDERERLLRESGGEVVRGHIDFGDAVIFARMEAESLLSRAKAE